MKKLFLISIFWAFILSTAFADQYDQYYPNASENWKNMQREADQQRQQQQINQQQQEINRLQRQQQAPHSTPIGNLLYLLLQHHLEKSDQNNSPQNSQDK